MKTTESFYSYTEVIGNYHSHTVFYMIATICLIMFVVGYLIQAEEHGDYAPGAGSIVGLIVIAVVLGIVSANSFGSGKLCTNVPVEVTLVDKTFIAEYKTGKHSTADFPHVVYQTPDGEVSFRRESGQIYPKYATLYKVTCVDH